MTSPGFEGVKYLLIVPVVLFLVLTKVLNPESEVSLDHDTVVASQGADADEQ